MITAKEASFETQKVISAQRAQAQKFIANEEEFLMAQMQESFSKGKYVASYWWSKEVLEENDVNRDILFTELQEMFRELKYRATLVINEDDSGSFSQGALAIHWDWRDVK